MQAEHQCGTGLCKDYIRERTVSYSTESRSTCSAVTSSSGSSSSSSSSGSSAAPSKQSTSAASSNNSNYIQLSSSCSTFRCHSSTSTSSTLRKRACRLYGMLTATGPRTTQTFNTAASAAAAASEEASNAMDEAHFAPKLTPGLDGMFMTNNEVPHHGPFTIPESLPGTHQGQPQAVYASCQQQQQQQQQQLGRLLQAIVAATACWQEVSLMPNTPQGLCHHRHHHHHQQQQQQQQQQLGLTTSSSQLELSAAHLHQPQYDLRPNGVGVMHMTAPSQQQQQQQQMSQHAHAQFAAVQQQWQQTQCVPVMVPPQACTASATVAMPFAAPSIQALNSGTCMSNAAASIETEQTRAETISSNSSGGSSLWGTMWVFAGTTVQQASIGKQSSTSSSSHSTGSAEGLTRKCTEQAQWLTSSWLYVLTCLVAALHLVHKAMQAVIVSILGKSFSCTNCSDSYMPQQLQLLQRAAVEAANAADNEHLRRLFGSRHRINKSCSSGSEKQLSAAKLVTELQETAPRQHLSSSSSDMSDLGGLEDFIITAGLCAGTAIWAGKWLVVHAPATTSNAITYRLQQGSKAAEEACLLLLECLLRGCYGLAWFMWKHAQGIAVQAVQLGAVHGAAAAQRACCVVLWMVALANASNSSNDQQQQLSAAQLLLAHVLQGGGKAAAQCGQVGVAAVESVVTAVAGKLLRDASPVTQTAVCGLAGMLRRNAVESCSLCWQLLLQLSQMYMIQQQQQWQQQELKQQ